MKHLLVVIDYQLDFVEGALGFAAAAKIEKRILQKIADAHAHADLVVFTLDTHTQDYLSTQEGRLLPVEHCVRGTAGWQLCPRVRELLSPRDLVFEKPSFGSPELFDYIRAHAAELSEIELCGVVSHICVLTNALLAKTAAPEARIVVDRQAIASFSDALHEAALMLLESVQVQLI